MKSLFLLMLMLLNVKLQASDFDKWTNKYDLLLQNNVITVTADGVESTVVDYRALVSLSKLIFFLKNCLYCPTRQH